MRGKSEEKIDKDVMREVEGMLETPQIPWDFSQSGDELTDAMNLEIPKACTRQSR